MAGFPILYKGSSAPNAINPGGISVLLPPGYSGTVDIVDPSGKNVIEGLGKNTIPHIAEPGDKGGEFGTKYYSRTPGSNIPPGSLLRVQNPNGGYSYVKIGSGMATFRGHIDEGEGTLENPAELAMTSQGQGGIPPGMTPGQVGPYGFYPGYLGGQFPSPVLGVYNPITAAPYTFTDPIEFAKRFGEFNREEITKNFGMAQDMALKELDTELKGLEQFVPAAAALKRSQTSIDNMFNQQQRTQQINQALPGVVGQLGRQASRAEAYASGRVPDSITDRALELGIRSNAADQGYAGGFGAGSSANRKASDLMSAEQRVKLSQYGDQLLNQNILTKANLFLAPTEYSDVGQQIKVNPEVGAARLTQESLQQINPLTTVTPGQGLESTIQQNQFTTQLEQNTRTFNASNQLQLSEFNANTQNQFAMDLFGYNVGYANSVAAAAQTNNQMNLQIQMQQQYLQIMMQLQQQAQSMQQIQSIISGGTEILTHLPDIITGGKKILNKLGS